MTPKEIAFTERFDAKLDLLLEAMSNLGKKLERHGAEIRKSCAEMNFQTYLYIIGLRDVQLPEECRNADTIVFDFLKIGSK